MTIEFNGTGGLMEGDFGTADINVNLESTPRFDETASATTNSYITGADINDMEVATYSIMCWFKPIPSNGIRSTPTKYSFSPIVIFKAIYFFHLK